MLRRSVQITSSVLLGLGGGGIALAAPGIDTTPLRTAVTVENVHEHLEAFQDFATASGGTRHAASPGFDASVDYVHDLMVAAGYNVVIQEFDFAFFQEESSAVLRQITPTATLYSEPDDFLTMEYSGSGDVTAPTQAVDIVPPTGIENVSTSGCEDADFAGFPAGAIAIIQRGTCTFAEKAANAEEHFAAGVVIFNEGQPGRTEVINGTLGAPGITIPVVGASFDVGMELAAPGVTAQIFVGATSEIRQSKNVIAETPDGRSDRVVVVGAHLDSVPEGPGINDNGSGSAAILEIALQMSELNISPRNQVRFVWWGAEESGLLGSEFYVSQLSKRDIKDIAVNLNFDMVGSPNFVRFVYDGDGSATATAGPNGSKVIEQVFLDYFASAGLATEPTAFDGRSDYGPFIAVGIPAGGLFTGAEGIKTAEEAAIYGGTAGLAYDPCYHLVCDDINNVSLLALDQMTDATAHATLTFAMTTSAVNGTDKANPKALQAIADSLTFKGPHAKK